ncbi:MAG: hypothetical protein KDD38_10265 [Bdellovibrionales bacterium]|nr:hypothetical protein [Bdellovibrionales bacterium]
MTQSMGAWHVHCYDLKQFSAAVLRDKPENVIIEIKVMNPDGQGYETQEDAAYAAYVDSYNNEKFLNTSEKEEIIGLLIQIEKNGLTRYYYTSAGITKINAITKIRTDIPDEWLSMGLKIAGGFHSHPYNPDIREAFSDEDNQINGTYPMFLRTAKGGFKVLERHLPLFDKPVGKNLCPEVSAGYCLDPHPSVP